MAHQGVLGNAAWLLGAQIANQLLPLLMIPYLSRTLGIESYGIYAYAMGIVTLAAVFTDFGCNLWATAEIAKNRGNRAQINTLIGTIYALKLGLLLIASLCIAAYCLTTVRYADYRAALLWMLIMLPGLALQPSWFFNGTERMASLVLMELAARGLLMLVVFSVIDAPSDLGLLLCLQGVSTLFAAGVGTLLIFKSGYRIERPTCRACLHTFRQARPFFLSRAAVSSYTAGGSVFLGLFSSVHMVAAYAVAEQLYRGGQAILSPFSQAIYPFIVRTRNFRVFAQALLASTLVAACGCVTTFFLGAEIITLIFGSEYAYATPVLYVFMATLLVNTPSVMLGYPMLGALGLLQRANDSVYIAGSIHLLILVWLYASDNINAHAVAMAVLIVEIVVLVLRAVWSHLGYRAQLFPHTP